MQSLILDHNQFNVTKFAIMANFLRKTKIQHLSMNYCKIGEEAGVVIGEALEEASELKSFECKSNDCLLYTSPSPRDRQKSRMPSSA